MHFHLQSEGHNGGFLPPFLWRLKMFYTITDKYIDYLSKDNPHVMSNKQETRTYHRKYIGIVTELGGHKYFVPMSSPKNVDYLDNGFYYIQALKVPKTDIHMKIDNDTLAWLKQAGKGYQQRLNNVLRWARMNNCPIATL